MKGKGKSELFVHQLVDAMFVIFYLVLVYFIFRDGASDIRVGSNGFFAVLSIFVVLCFTQKLFKRVLGTICQSFDGAFFKSKE